MCHVFASQSCFTYESPYNVFDTLAVKSSEESVRCSYYLQTRRKHNANPWEELESNEEHQLTTEMESVDDKGVNFVEPTIMGILNKAVFSTWSGVYPARAGVLLHQGKST